MPIILLVARAELRSSARLLLGLGVLVALVSGLVLATWAGADRTETSVDRMREATHARDLEVQVDAEPGVAMTVYEELVDIPGVAGVGTMPVAPVMVVGGEASDELREGAGLAVMGDLGDLDVDQPLILEGRSPAADAADEVLVNQVVLDGTGSEVGDRISLVTLTPDELWCLAGKPCTDGFGMTGPQLDVEIVGLGRLADDLQGSNSSAGPLLVVSPALEEQWQDEVGFFPPMAGLHLEAGADVDAVSGDVVDLARRLGGDDLQVQVTRADELFADSARDSVGVLANGLRVVGIVALGAGLLVVAQATRRHLLARQSRMVALRSLGASRSTMAGALALPVGGSLVVGVVLGVPLAVAASPLFPVGLGRLADPNGGAHVDGPILFGIGAGLMVVLLVMTMALAWAATTPRSTADDRRGGTAGRRTLAWSSPVATFGRHLAYPRTPRAARISASSAAIGVSVAIAGLIAAITVGDSVNATIAQPERWGWNWDSAAEVDGPEEVSDLVQRDEVEEAGLLHIGKVELSGRQVGGFALEPLRGDLQLTTVAGRLPVSDDEVALGPETLAELDTEIGGSLLDVEGQALTVVGTVVMPPNFDNSDTDRGAVLTPAGLDAAKVADGYVQVVLRWVPGSDVRAMEDDLTSGGTRFTVVRPPGSLNNIGRTNWLTRLLAALFAVFGVAGLAHAMVISARRNRGDAAVVAALGFQSRDIRRSVVLQAVMVAAIGLVVGIPAGLIIGRAAWHLVVDGIGVVETATTPFGAALVVVPVALVLAAVAALGPAWSVARRPHAPDLRAE